ncbi:MAG: MipA/OmpV family protein [Rhodobacteraceae bacterium]|nr:MipA/OmpV family protein [Paracoccaceae bacterium]
MPPNPRLGALTLTAALAAGLAPALAQTGSSGPAPATEVDVIAAPGTTGVAPPTGPGARFTIGAGASYTPDYFGSDENSFGPAGTLRFDYIRLPGGIEFGSTGGVGFIEGFGPRGSARYIGNRKASDNSELDGLDNVDAALELGLGLGYDAAYWRAFADVRYGFIGHSSWVGEFGADAILRPNDAWVVNFGPRANWGASRFMNTYFGVSGSEADESGFDEYDASSGFYSAGLELGARYSFSEAWGVEGRANYERLINDAADSPIVEAGTQNQFGVQVMITRSLSLGF